MNLFRLAVILALAGAFAPARPAGYQIAFAPYQSETATGALRLHTPRERSGIFVMNQDGTDRRRLTNDEVALLMPGSWSPDGRTIVYFSYESPEAFMRELETYQLEMHLLLYAVNANGTNRRRLVDFPVNAFGPWSPDGRYLFLVSAFEGNPASEVWGYVVDVRTGMRTRVAGPGSVVFEASWSPDGGQLVFADRKGAGGLPGVYLVNRDGSGRTHLTGSSANVFTPRWSPDGRFIAFVLSEEIGDRLTSGTWNFELKTRKLTRVGKSGEWRWSMPLWTPQSRLLLIVRDQKGEVLLLSADGGTRARLGRAGLDYVLSPDGLEVYFRTVPPEPGIWAIGIDGGARRKVVDLEATFCLSPPTRRGKS